jgi:hypothetical protein
MFKRILCLTLLFAYSLCSWAISSHTSHRQRHVCISHHRHFIADSNLNLKTISDIKEDKDVKAASHVVSPEHVFLNFVNNEKFTLM